MTGPELFLAIYKISDKHNFCFMKTSNIHLPELLKRGTNIITWKRSHVFEPSPQGVLRVVIRSTFVGIRTGPY